MPTPLFNWFCRHCWPLVLPLAVTVAAVTGDITGGLVEGGGLWVLLAVGVYFADGVIQTAVARRARQVRLRGARTDNRLMSKQPRI